MCKTFSNYDSPYWTHWWHFVTKCVWAHLDHSLMPLLGGQVQGRVIVTILRLQMSKFAPDFEKMKIIRTKYVPWWDAWHTWSIRWGRRRRGGTRGTSSWPENGSIRALHCTELTNQRAHHWPGCQLRPIRASSERADKEKIIIFSILLRIISNKI